jgi:hypothetical protein
MVAPPLAGDTQMSDSASHDLESDHDPRSAYLEMRGDLQRVLELPLKGREYLFREILVGYLMVEHDYGEQRARGLVTGNEAAILMMLTEEQDSGLW